MGYVDVDKGRVLTPGVDVGKTVELPVPSYLIETDSGERVLIDTGMHEVHIDDPDHTFGDNRELASSIAPRMGDEHRLGNQLGELDLGVADIETLVNTHLHFDHCGQNHLFEAASILVQRRCYEAAIAAGRTREYFDVPGLSYGLLEGDCEIGEGISLLVTPGHAPGHMSVLVQRPCGPILLCGDAIPTLEVLEGEHWDAFEEPETAAKSAERLVEVAKAEGARMLFGHDSNQWKEVPHAHSQSHREVTEWGCRDGS